MWSVDDFVIRNDKDETGTSVRQALEDAAVHCANADRAEPLFRDVLARLEATRDELQTQYPNAPLDDKQRALRSFVEEVVKFAGLLQQYCSMSFADRVLQHKKIAKRLREVHAGAPNVYNYLEGGLDNVTILLREDKRPSTAWREPFDAAAAAFEAAVAESVNDDATVSLYRQDSLLALEAATLLCNAQKNGDRLQWHANTAAQHLRDKIKDIADSDDVQLPEWFVPESDINYKSRRFAKGSFGAVHYGTWGSGTKVVVKVLLDEDRDKRLSAKLREKFIEEADLWSKMSHPYILKLYGACHVTAPPFFVCEDATKGDLSEYLKKDKSRLWRFLFQSALAIEYLHGKKVIHGDLKLNNILVGADGYARVADFGLSRFKKPTGNRTLTKHDSVLDGAGALRWRAPEALLHKAQYESDVYSFGLCMIEALSGEIPYANLPDDEVIANIEKGVLPERPADMSDEIWTLVQKMTASEPSERATIKQVIVVLKKLANAELDKETESMSLCQICSSIMTDGSNFCRKCRRNVVTKPMSKEVGPILSKEDLPRVIELVTLSNGQHEHKAPNALRDYMFGQPDHQKYVHDAGGIPVLAKVLGDDELESLVRLEALTGLGCTMVANKKIQNTAKFENVVEMLKYQLHNGDERVKTKAVLVLGYMAHGNPDNRKELVADTVMLERIREYARGPEDDDLPMAATRALLFLEPQTSPANAG